MAPSRWSSCGCRTTTSPEWSLTALGEPQLSGQCPPRMPWTSHTQCRRRVPGAGALCCGQTESSDQNIARSQGIGDEHGRMLLQRVLYRWRRTLNPQRCVSRWRSPSPLLDNHLPPGRGWRRHCHGRCRSHHLASHPPRGLSQRRFLLPPRLQDLLWSRRAGIARRLSWSRRAGPARRGMCIGFASL